MERYKLMPIIYTDKLPASVGGRLVAGLFAKIRPEYKDDIGLHEHEYMHFKQTWRLLWFPHIMLYRLSKTYRMASEVEAFAKQLEYAKPEDRMRMMNYYARFLATHYGLGVSLEEALSALRYRCG